VVHILEVLDIITFDIIYGIEKEEILEQFLNVKKEEIL